MLFRLFTQMALAERSTLLYDQHCTLFYKSLVKWLAHSPLCHVILLKMPGVMSFLCVLFLLCSCFFHSSKFPRSRVDPLTMFVCCVHTSVDT